MQWLKQSTSITVRFGPFLDETDAKTAETGLTISQADIRLSKNGGDFAQTNDAGGATHDENGWYYLTLDATDTATLGRLNVAVHESGALPCWTEYMILPANVYDSLVSGSDYLKVDLVENTVGSSITYTNPVASDNKLTIYRGSDYGPTLDNDPTWSEGSWTNATWAAATAQFTYRHVGDTVGINAGTATVSQSGDTLTVGLTLTDTETLAMTAYKHATYELWVESAGGLKRCLGYGEMEVLDRMTTA